MQHPCKPAQTVSTEGILRKRNGKHGRAHLQHYFRVPSVGQIWSHCPRSALKRVLQRIQEKHGFTFLIGQEIEFYVLGDKFSDPLSKQRLPGPVDTSMYCQTWALDNMAGLMDDIAHAVESLDIPVEQLHAESGPGQFELAVSPSIGAPC